MTIGVLLLNFGEPSEATPQAVIPYLERIFLMNAPLEAHAAPEAARARARQLAEQRAPGLIAEYAAIGGSPLNQQAQRQADDLAVELRRRGLAARVYVAMQFADPLIEDVLRRARADGVERLVALPVYPVCGPSTNVMALEQTRAALDAIGWDVPMVEVSGWHRHPAYAPLRAEGIAAAAAAAGVDLADPAVRLVFSAHGTPLKYIEAGSRYRDYTEENCRAIADVAGVERFELGYQNHGNRPIEWTKPDIGDVIEHVAADAVVVVPVSFMHEQSETLSELDIELRQEAEERGLRFVRVPVPHDDPRFIAILADLVESALRPGDGPVGLRPCRCRRTPDTFCTNG
ncbi:MAG: ferrochelatase [Gemmatimonadetes bacterium]|nr:ferrochelatase [Gemmatimonadota bacterium]